MSGVDAAYTNTTLVDHPHLCTLHTCPLTLASIRYVPSLGGNAFYAAVFILVLLIQIFLGIRYRTWNFLIAFFGGEVLEVLGYIGRIQMHFNPFLGNPFLLYLICLTIAPAFLCAGIYLCLSRIIVVYGEHLARFKPRTYTIIFISCDIFCLVLQAVGGALADTSNKNKSLGQAGVNIMIAGLSCQVVSLTVFIVLCGDFAGRVWKNGASPRETLLKFGCSLAKFHGFLFALATATLTIFVRSCFRVAELHGGFGGRLANQEVPFMILEGAMVVVASTAMTVMHPGLVLKGVWNLDRARAEILREDGGGEGKGNVG